MFSPIHIMIYKLTDMSTDDPAGGDVTVSPRFRPNRTKAVGVGVKSKGYIG